MKFTSAKKMIESARKVLITTHIRPDGDAIGSMTALKGIIEDLSERKGQERQVQLLLLSNPSENYMFLFAEKPWIWGSDILSEQPIDDLLEPFDLIIVVDTSAVRQLPGISEYLVERTKNAEQTGKNVLVIDHHLTGDAIGNCLLVDPGVCAAGEIVFDLSGHLLKRGEPLKTDVAGALLTAIGTDTGWFRFENSTARAFEIAGELIRAGVKADELYQKLYQNFPPERLMLLNLTLETLELQYDGRLAVMQITKAILEKSRAKRSYIENIVNEPQQIGTVIAVVLLVEQEDGTTRVSLRSKNTIDVNAVARKFGGGGHARAAGLTLKADLAEARKRVVQAMGESLP